MIEKNRSNKLNLANQINPAKQLNIAKQLNPLNILTTDYISIQIKDYLHCLTQLVYTSREIKSTYYNYWKKSTCYEDIVESQSLVKWSLDNRCPTTNPKLIMYASRYGDIETIKYLREKNALWDRRAPLFASKHGHLELLKYLYEEGCDCDKGICDYAAFKGHKHILEWCVDKFKFTKWTCASAAQGGHLDILIWLKELGTEWDYNTTSRASYNGHIEVLKWCKENNAEFNSTLYTWSAFKGHINVLQWAWDNNDNIFKYNMLNTLNNSIIDLALLGKQPDVIKWITKIKQSYKN